MRRKRERSAAKKAKASPEKKVEKVKRSTRSRRRKQSTSSENDSGEESNVGQVPEVLSVTEQIIEQTSTKTDSPEESQEQVWQVKSAEGDVGEIQKLKICLTRPPSTPERVDRSPRSKRKLSRTASCSDSTSVDGSEEKKKTKHRTKRSICELSENLDKSSETQNDNQESNAQTESTSANIDTERDLSSKTELPVNQISPSKSHEETKADEGIDNAVNEENVDASKQSETETSIIKESEIQMTMPSDTDVINESENEKSTLENQNEQNTSTLSENDNQERERSMSVDKSEVLEIHPDESKCDISDLGVVETQKEENKGNEESQEGISMKVEESDKVSLNEDTEKNVFEKSELPQCEIKVSTNENDVVAEPENTVNISSKRNSTDSTKDTHDETSSECHKKEIERSESLQSNNEETVHNGHTNIVINRKRRWGSRSNKLVSQKSITISTDVLKEIIPDVKPVEFDEVIEEKKPHKRVEVTEKVERPILPKIVIDNTENVEQNKRELEDKNKENLKVQDAAPLTSSRKISIVKDTDNIAVIRPPSPPRHKQSSILYITNLVRPFTLPQLKNLLQRTGRIVENGFWIDRIKSKCFVIYETEDQAVETRHALHGVTWPVSNPKTLHVDFSTQEEFDKAKANEETDNAQTSTIPGTVEDWLREQDLKRERGELEKPWERKTMREWDVGKNEKGKEKEKEKLRRDDRSLEKRRHHTPERSPEPAKKFKKKEEAPAKLLDDLFRKTKTTPCIYWLPLSAETIAIKEEQRRQHMAEHERRLLELRRTHRRH